MRQEYACNPIYNQFYSQNIYYSYVILRLIILKTLQYHQTNKKFFHSLKNLLHEYFIKYWKEQIQQGGNNGKLRVYKNLKINFGCERYLYLVQNFKYRQAVTKLRISAHRYYLLKLVDITMFHTMIGYVNIVT